MSERECRGSALPADERPLPRFCAVSPRFDLPNAPGGVRSRSRPARLGASSAMPPSQESAAAFRVCGYGQSRKNPQLCARSRTAAPEGGAVVLLPNPLWRRVRWLHNNAGRSSLHDGVDSSSTASTRQRRRRFGPFEGLLGQIAEMRSWCSSSRASPVARIERKQSRPPCPCWTGSGTASRRRTGST